MFGSVPKPGLLYNAGVASILSLNSCLLNVLFFLTRKSSAPPSVFDVILVRVLLTLNRKKGVFLNLRARVIIFPHSGAMALVNLFNRFNHYDNL